MSSVRKRSDLQQNGRPPPQRLVDRSQSLPHQGLGGRYLGRRGPGDPRVQQVAWPIRSWSHSVSRSRVCASVLRRCVMRSFSGTGLHRLANVVDPLVDAFHLRHLHDLVDRVSRDRAALTSPTLAPREKITQADVETAAPLEPGNSRLFTASYRLICVDLSVFMTASTEDALTAAAPDEEPPGVVPTPAPPEAWLASRDESVPSDSGLGARAALVGRA